MKLATFSNGAAHELGVVTDGGQVVSLSRAAPMLARDMTELITRGEEISGEVVRMAAAGEHAFALDAVRLHAPIARPGKIMAIGLNYADHVAESQMETPAHQICLLYTSRCV